MRALTLLPLALAASAFVIPDRETANALVLENQESSHPFWDNHPSPERIWEDVEQKFQDAKDCAKNKFDDVIDKTFDFAVKYGEKFEDAFVGDAWLETMDEELDVFGILEDDHPPHHGPPHHGPPHDGPPHKGPHHPPHHGPPNMTVYQLIASSKYTTKLAAAINEFPDLVKLLNGTTANYTVFAPTDAAFAKIPEHAPKPPKEFLEKLLTYHISPDFYPAGRVLSSRTIPTALKADLIADNPQRLSTQIGFKGLTVNFYARIVAINIFGTNGVIHGIDSILLPPPKATDIINAFPSVFSTLELGLYKTGLFDIYNSTTSHTGGTLFAPTNNAFAHLGPRANAFLFSPYGLKYLKAVLLYHTVPNITLYSDAIYKVEDRSEHPHPGPPKGVYHIDLPTALEGKSLSVDIARYGRLIEIKINAFTRVAVLDGIARDGVIHVLGNVLIPPKSPGSMATSEDNIDVEDLKARLDPYVEDDQSEYEMEL